MLEENGLRHLQFWRARYAASGGVRFAPSPTGNFHLGNLRSAWVSREIARSAGLPWVLRFEDIDIPRVVAGARERQTQDLQALGLKADREYLQSELRSTHAEIFAMAARAGLLYPCVCSRREVQENLAAMSSAPHGEPAVYDGHCRRHLVDPLTAPAEVAWRFRDQGDKSGIRDFIVGRGHPSASATFWPAYHWACAIDDWLGHHEVIVRAWDLAASAIQQRNLQRALATHFGEVPRFPAIFHCALVVHDDGHRLEKRSRGVTLAEALEQFDANQILKKFQASVDESAINFVALGQKWDARIGGEQKKQLTLSQLGFKPSL